MIRVLDSAGSTLVEWGRQQQHDYDERMMIIIIVKMPTSMPTMTWMTWLLTMMVVVMTTIVLMMTINNIFNFIFH